MREQDRSEARGAATPRIGSVGIGVNAIALGRSDAFLAWAGKLLGESVRGARDLPAALSALREQAADVIAVYIPDLEFRPQRAFEALSLEAPGVPLIGVDAGGDGNAHARDLDLLVAGMVAEVSMQTPRVDTARLLRALTRRRDELRRDAEQHKQIMQQLIRFETWSTRRLDALERWIADLQVPIGVIRAGTAELGEGTRAEVIERIASAGAMLATLADRGRTELSTPPELDVDLEARRAGGRSYLSPHQLCGEVVDVLRAESAKSGVRLRLEERDCPKIWADRIRLTQALVNLVKLAWSRTARGGSVTIALSPIEPTGETPWPRCSIVVSDTGEDGSIDAVVAEGSELSAVRRVVEEHGGELDVDTTSGCSTTYRIELPIDPRRRRRRARVRVASDPRLAALLLRRLQDGAAERIELETEDDVEACVREISEESEGTVVIEPHPGDR
ncbi:MAG: HAMP domain-containing histidine kinase [Acidobacteriota bacterium]|nr:HAMP domain-containing histidine kinase [Acidobacteriota bacterium]